MVRLRGIYVSVFKFKPYLLIFAQTVIDEYAHRSEGNGHLHEAHPGCGWAFLRW